MRRAMMGTALVLCCAIGSWTEPEDEGALRCEMKLRNGSLIKGSLKSLEDVQLKTRYGMLKVPVKDLKSLAWGDIKKEEADTVVAKDGTYRGWLEEMPPLEVDTGYGTLKVPTTAIRSMRVMKPGKPLGDDFEDASLDNWQKFGSTSWAVVDGRLKNQPSGNYDSIQYSEELEGSYTIELDVTNANNAGILWNAQDQNNAVGLWLNPGNVRVFSGGTWYNQQTAYWGFQYAWNTTIHVKIEVDGTQAVIWIGESKVGEVTVSGKGGRVGLFDFNGQALFDNVQITR